MSKQADDTRLGKLHSKTPMIEFFPEAALNFRHSFADRHSRRNRTVRNNPIHLIRVEVVLRIAMRPPSTGRFPSFRPDVSSVNLRHGTGL